MKGLKSVGEVTSFDNFNQDNLCYLFRFFTPTQLRTIAPVCRTWRKAVFERALPDSYLNSIPAKLRDAEIFNKYPLNKARLMQSLAFEAGSSEGSFIDIMTEAWELAAFNGLYDACAEFLGSELLTKKRIDGATVMHLASMGGQKEMLAKLSENNKEALLCKDLQGNTLLDYASFFGQVDCMAWLLENTTLKLETTNDLGFVCIDTFKQVKLPRPLILKLAFLLTSNYNNNALIEKLSTEQKEHIILATRAYIESKTRTQDELEQISMHLKSSNMMMN